MEAIQSDNMVVRFIGKPSVDVDAFLPDRFAFVDTESYQSVPLKHHEILQKRH